MTKAEEEFVEQYARVFLVEWCCQTLDSGSIQTTQALPQAGAKVAGLCMEHAKDKGWVGKSIPVKVTAKGFLTAASFLKR